MRALSLVWSFDVKTRQVRRSISATNAALIPRSERTVRLKRMIEAAIEQAKSAATTTNFGGLFK